MIEKETHIKQNLDEIWGRIKTAQAESGIAAGAVTLIAVSKTKPAVTIIEALQAGQLHFGENRVQEATLKWPSLLEEYRGAKLHLIGRLQSNKVAEAINVFHAIHSLDSERLAVAIAKEIQKQGRIPEIFIQVNIGEEEQKGGVAPSQADGLVAVCHRLSLNLQGLMCIPPAEEEPSPHFALLRKIAERNGLKGLSMGMSGDFEKAVRMGATHVRVGTAIFGERSV